MRSSIDDSTAEVSSRGSTLPDELRQSVKSKEHALCVLTKQAVVVGASTYVRIMSCQGTHHMDYDRFNSFIPDFATADCLEWSYDRHVFVRVRIRQYNLRSYRKVLLDWAHFSPTTDHYGYKKDDDLEEYAIGNAKTTTKDLAWITAVDECPAIIAECFRGNEEVYRAQRVTFMTPSGLLNRALLQDQNVRIGDARCVSFTPFADAESLQIIEALSLADAIYQGGLKLDADSIRIWNRRYYRAWRANERRSMAQAKKLFGPEALQRVTILKHPSESAFEPITEGPDVGLTRQNKATPERGLEDRRLDAESIYGVHSAPNQRAVKEPQEVSGSIDRAHSAPEHPGSVRKVHSPPEYSGIRKVHSPPKQRADKEIQEDSGSIYRTRSALKQRAVKKPQEDSESIRRVHSAPKQRAVEESQKDYGSIYGQSLIRRRNLTTKPVLISG